jgi:hypothetical protein
MSVFSLRRMMMLRVEGTYMLKLMALASMAAMKFPKMRFARGEFRMRWRGMMGMTARDSNQRKVGKAMAAIERAVRTTGWVPVILR